MEKLIVKNDMYGKNIKEIYVYGLHRCGNHAIINYILGHVIKRIPNYKSLIKDGKELLREEKIHINRVNRKFMKSNNPPFPEYIPFQILSHENMKIKKTQLLYDTGRKNTTKKAIIVLRDPYNMIASLVAIDRAQKKSEIMVLKRMEEAIKLWKYYLNEFFLEQEETEWLFPVVYNKWFVDKEYRKKISTFIGEDHTDLGLNVVNSTGSSFDKFKYNKNAQKMDVFNRWKTLDKKFKDIIKEDKELRYLSKQIFNYDIQDNI